MSDIVMEVEGLTRKFGGLIAVDEVNFAVEENEIFGLIGPNGAGKTTLFNLITGLIPVSSGRVIYKGRKISNLPPHEIAARGIARTFQNLRLFKNLSALENVAIGGHLHSSVNLFSGVFCLPVAKKEEDKTYRQARDLLALVGLKDKEDKKAGSFAYGDQRRLEIARALALQPQVLLLDEPAAGLNPSEKVALSQFIREIRDRFNLTVILIEHHVPLVMGLCDRIAVLDFGRLIALGEPGVVRNDPAVIEAYLGDE